MSCRIFCAGIVAVVAVVYTLLTTPNVVRDSVFGYPPANSSLANFGWPPLPRISEEDVRTFHESGFVVLRQVMDPIVVDLMLEEAVRDCSWQLFLSRFCYLRQTRWSVDLFRDFLFHGPIGSIAHEFVQGSGVRVVQDGVFGVRRTWSPFVFSSLPHVDHGGNPGVYGRFHSNASGVSVWMPLQDIDAEADGGSIVLYENFTNQRCQTHFGSVITNSTLTINTTEQLFKCHIEALKLRQTAKSFRKGDIVLYNPSMLHNDQPLLNQDLIRYAWHAWLVDSDALNCFVRDCWNRGEPCCSSKLPGPGESIHTPCYAQIHPSMLPEELEAHFQDRPQPMITWRPKKSIPILELNHTCSERHRIVA
mmetsp:Transcript_36173/g.72833  ORF Transcript_36173/g.72833 Transcript_36173/m.72833 type:complete len:363 (-) Transcript_36173:62-1150(-)